MKQIHRWIAALLGLCMIVSLSIGISDAYASLNIGETREYAVCIHHPVHTEDCGYAEGRSCTFICETCEHTVADWVWNDAYEMLRPGADYGYSDVDWVLDVPESTEDILNIILPETVTASLISGECVNMPISWDTASYAPYAPASARNGRLYTAMLPEGYILSDNASGLTVLVLADEVGEQSNRNLYANDGIMPIAIIDRDINIVDVDFTGQSLFNNAQSGVTMQQIIPYGSSNAIVSDGGNNQYHWYLWSQGRPYLRLNRGSGNAGGALNYEGLTSLTVSMRVFPASLDKYNANTKHWYFRAALDESTGADGSYIGIYFQGSRNDRNAALYAVKVVDGTEVAVAKISRWYDRWVANITATFTDTGVSLTGGPDNVTNNEDTHAASDESKLAAFVGSDDGVVYFGRNFGNSNFYGSIDDIKITGHQYYDNSTGGGTGTQDPTPVTPPSGDSPMHFIVRHWHSDDVTEGVNFQKNETEQGNGRYFVVAEGFIVPIPKTDPDWGNVINGEQNYYRFYAVDRQTGANKEITDDFVGDSGYVYKVNRALGRITLSSNPVCDDDGNALEEFSGFSISAGHRAIVYRDTTKDGEKDSLWIEYDENVHLVKAHVFYISTNRSVQGTNDESVFGTSGLTNGNREFDTAWVYVYTNTYQGHNVGDIAKDSNNEPYTADNPPTGDLLSHVELTKVYNTLEGLHTDKTAYEADEPRRFDLELEAWYSEGQSPQVGMVLDASGSMAFTSGTPEKIHLTDAEIAAIDTELAKVEGSTYKRINKLPNVTANGGEPKGGWDDYFLTYNQISQILDSNNTDNSPLAASGYNYFVYDPTDSVMEFAPLAYWEGGAVRTGTKQRGIKAESFHKFDKSSDNELTGDGRNPGSMVQQQTMSGTIDFTKSASSANYEVMWSSTDNRNDYNNGFLRITKSSNVASGKTDAAFRVGGLNSRDGNFTIAFRLWKKEATNDSPTKEGNILYVGPSNGNASSNYFRLTRQTGTSSNRLSSYKGSNGEMIASMNSVFDSNSVVHYVFCVFETSKVTGKTTVSTYVYRGNDCATAVPVAADYGNATKQEILLDGYNIFFNPFNTGYDGNTLCVDEVFVLDAPLTDTQVGTFVKNYTNFAVKDFDKDNFPSGSTDPYIASFPYDYEDYVYPDRVQMQDKNGNTVAVASVNYGDSGTFHQQGWYYLTHVGEWDHYKDVGTNKQLIGVMQHPNSSQSENGNAATNPLKDVVFGPGQKGSQGSTDGTGYVYNPLVDNEVKFYFDNAGNLRCFFSSGRYYNSFASYVYEIEDKDYIKTESLQRALSSFVTNLLEQSPTTEVSATRFSTNQIPESEYNKLVMLDWTIDPYEAARVLSLDRGVENNDHNDENSTVGTSTSYTSSEGTTDHESIEQYNYGLTGSTSTQTGLQSFIDNLDGKFRDTQTNAKKRPKYLIIFTDGRDTDINDANKKENFSKHPAVEKANTLKQNEYTIFTVLLSGGPVTLGTEQYTEAENFLLALSGKTQTGANTKLDDNQPYFFSIEKAKEKMKSDGKYTPSEIDAMQDEDILTEIFTGQILAEITRQLTMYTVEDYIDPRFDLVDKDGAVWSLNARGNVTKTSYEYNNQGVLTGTVSQSYSLADGVTVPFELTNESDPQARTPVLCYNAEKDLYYLRWTEQNIPGTTEATAKLYVWRARITVQAKEDFIGGNAVLTNGNGVSMNWVYYDRDTHKSSGTDDMYIKDNDTYPSKGFPRTTVNVGMIPGLEDKEKIVYLGETVTPELLAKELINYNRDNVEDAYYWLDYLDRYARKLAKSSEAEKIQNSLNTLIQGIVNDPNADITDKDTTVLTNGIEIPYSYLPNVPRDGEGNLVGGASNNQTGLSVHEDDVLGKLIYRWERVAPGTDTPLDDGGYGGTGAGPKKSTLFIVQDTRDVQYKFTVTYRPYPDPDDPLWTQYTRQSDATNWRNALIKTLNDKITALQEEIGNDGNDGKAISGVYNKINDLKAQLAATTDPDKQKSLQEKIIAAYVKIQSLQKKIAYYNDQIAQIKDAVNDPAYFEWCLGDENEDGTKNSKLRKRYGENYGLVAGSGEELNYTPPTEGELDNSGNQHNFKDAVGGAAYGVTSSAPHTTYIVRGELAFEMEFKLEDLITVFGGSGAWKGKDAMTYKVNVKREYTDSDGWKPTIPDLEITVKKADLGELTSATSQGKIYYKDADGNDTAYPRAVYDSTTKTVTYYSSPLIFDPAYKDAADGNPLYPGNDTYARLLPIGTYTLTPADNQESGWSAFKFDKLTYAPRDDYKRECGHFTDSETAVNSVESVYRPGIWRELWNTLVEDGGKKSPYYDENHEKDDPHYYGFEKNLTDNPNNVVFELGTHDYGDDTISYLEDRVGMAKIKADIIPLLDLPGAHGFDVSVFWYAGAGLVLISLSALFLFTRKRIVASDKK